MFQGKREPEVSSNAERAYKKEENTVSSVGKYQITCVMKHEKADRILYSFLLLLIIPSF